MPGTGSAREHSHRQQLASFANVMLSQMKSCSSCAASLTRVVRRRDRNSKPACIPLIDENFLDRRQHPALHGLRGGLDFLDEISSVATSHRAPTFVKHGVIHYCVDNMAGVVPITSTVALTNATLPYIIEVADSGVVAAARSDPALARGINAMEGKITIKEVAEATGYPYFPLEYVLPIEYM